MRGTYYFSYRRRGAFAPVRFGCYSEEQAFYLANQKWSEGHHDTYTMFQVEYVECGEWETIYDYINHKYGVRFVTSNL